MYMYMYICGSYKQLWECVLNTGIDRVFPKCVLRNFFRCIFMFLYRRCTGFQGSQRYVGWMIVKRALFGKKRPFGRSRREWELNVKKCKYVCVRCEGVIFIHGSQYGDSYKYGTNRGCSF